MPKGYPNKIIDGMKKCGMCKTLLPLSEFHENDGGSYCKNCHKEYKRNWRHKTGRQTPHNKNKTCSSYLGVHVAEQVLGRVFPNVIKMPYGNRGYDFICGKGFKVDVKSSCQQHRIGHKQPQWKFTINGNIIADYFACIAFDNRTLLTPLYFWLIPKSYCESINSLSISQSTLEKWDVFRKSIDLIMECCNTMRGVE